MIMMRSTGNELTHKRVNAIQGYDFKGAGATGAEGAVADESPTIAELANAANWRRLVERKAAGIEFLVSKL